MMIQLLLRIDVLSLGRDLSKKQVLMITAKRKGKRQNVVQVEAVVDVESGVGKRKESECPKRQVVDAVRMINVDMVAHGRATQTIRSYAMWVEQKCPSK
jgi:hypothetical protein